MKILTSLSAGNLSNRLKELRLAQAVQEALAQIAFKRLAVGRVSIPDRVMETMSPLLKVLVNQS